MVISEQNYVHSYCILLFKIYLKKKSLSSDQIKFSDHILYISLLSKSKNECSVKDYLLFFIINILITSYFLLPI